ncbi:MULTISPECIES: EFR1 family ferrodoxin [unclassified Clostridium]|uniref:EFR1 family ferrodoxin n=1 Tax=unclassified Clostridium TaxID=2614128 RepID=UPI0002977463|nr:MULTISPECIES: EFR1 family ferrodoxin [unclassified Clostridium]EKQ52812.1 MAG: 4Fe-4S protein [Clostridium sp. Maddingley MBC34-26]
MKLQSLKLVCFSPTGTTKKIIQGIAYGINQGTTELIDITKPDARKQQIQTSENELLVVAVPVYMGRVPELLNEWLYSIKARNTPAVCIVVYGNRVYDDALLELKDILIKCGCKPIAGAAFIGEHSFSSSETPIAEARPDASDLNKAELFGRKIYDKLLSISLVDQISDINVPGNYPYGGITKLWNVDFIAVSNDCTQCGICAKECPVGAIDSENCNLIDNEKCITCCACIKNCPQNARMVKTSLVKDAAIRLNNLYKDRKEPVFFL